MRQAGFDALQQEQMVLRYVREHGSITRAEVVEKQVGSRRWARYVAPQQGK